MLLKSIEVALNKQIAKESNASYYYLSMASWCERFGLPGSAKFLYDHSEKERQHMLRLFKYINEAGNCAIVPEVERPQQEFKSLSEIFELVYKHEKAVTESINNLVELCLAEKDFSSFHFLQWYVAEQHEEEHLFNSILNKIKLIGTSQQGIFLADREIGQMIHSNK